MTRSAWPPSNWIFTPYVRMGNTPPARSGKVPDSRSRLAMPPATPSSRRTYTNGAGPSVLSLRSQLWRADAHVRARPLGRALALSVDSYLAHRSEEHTAELQSPMY